MALRRRQRRMRWDWILVGWAVEFEDFWMSFKVRQLLSLATVKWRECCWYISRYFTYDAALPRVFNPLEQCWTCGLFESYILETILILSELLHTPLPMAWMICVLRLESRMTPKWIGVKGGTCVCVCLCVCACVHVVYSSASSKHHGLDTLLFCFPVYVSTAACIALVFRCCSSTQ